MKAIALAAVIFLAAVPAQGDLGVTLKWVFDTDQIITIPVVADVDNDGHTDIVVNLTQTDGGSWESGNIAVLDGVTGVEAFRIPHDPDQNQYGSHGRSTIAVGDVNGDRVPDIIYASREMSGNQSLIVAVDGNGSLLWKSHDPGGLDYFFTIVNGAITLGNFDDDEEAEVVVGATLLDHDGTVYWDEGGGGLGSTHGSNENYTGGISAVADLTDDGILEIISGKEAWMVDWQPGPSVNVVPFWVSPQPDGYPAIADLDGDGIPEVILVAEAKIQVLNGFTGELLAEPVNLPGGVQANRGGPAAIADFDGDGLPEIGVASGWTYSVFDFNPTGLASKQPSAAITLKWSSGIQDFGSSSTGSSAFDFEGDGIAEVLFADECYWRVYSGIDGSILLEIPNSSSTIHEYPLVVDIDGEGGPEILVVANSHSGCPEPERIGLYVYGPDSGQWAVTRDIWTQHTYHVTNATGGGNVPLVESNNWLIPGLNNYRQSALDPWASPVIGGNEEGPRPILITLHEPFPNPFNPHTTIAFELPSREPVSLRVFDMAGRMVDELVRGEVLDPGRHEVIWNGCDQQERKVSAGVYFFRLGVGDFYETKRMMMVK